MRVAGYMRVSTEEQKKYGVSIGQQEAELKKWAVENGHEYVGAYSDAGISARKRYTKRPSLLRMLEDVKAGKIDLIIFTKLDRWFRNVADYYDVQRILDQNGVAWKAIWEDYETETASGRLKVNIMLSVAQDEADRTSERIRKTNEYRWSSGDVAQKLPVGYKRVEKKVVIDEEKKPAVDAFFATYLKTGNVSASVDAAAALGHNVTLVGARRMLRNPFYAGSVRGIDVPPYISKSQYATIQRMRAQYTRRPKKDNVYLFSGLLICGNCGGRLSTQKNKSTVYYVCGPYINKSVACTDLDRRGYANENKLEEWLLRNLDDCLARYLDDIAKGNFDVEVIDEKHTLEAEMQKLETQLSRLKTLFVLGDINIDDYQQQKAKIRSKMDAISMQAGQTVDAEKVKNILPDHWQDIYSELTRAGKREFWRRTIKSITIAPGQQPRVSFL